MGGNQVVTCMSELIDRRYNITVQVRKMPGQLMSRSCTPRGLIITRYCIIFSVCVIHNSYD